MSQKETEVPENREATYENDKSNAESEVSQSDDQIESGDNEEVLQAEEQLDSSNDEVEFIAKEKFEEVQKLADENYQRYLRAQADLDNFRRRTRLEKEEAAKYASIHLIEQLLPIVDNFDRAITSSKTNPDFDSLARGIDMIFKQLSQALEEEGLKTIEAVGKPFDPDFHQAIMQVESEEHEEGIVVEEVQKGFMLKDRVLRPAMVKVSQ